jgi:hypothetical protein
VHLVGFHYNNITRILPLIVDIIYVISELLSCFGIQCLTSYCTLLLHASVQGKGLVNYDISKKTCYIFHIISYHLQALRKNYYCFWNLYYIWRKLFKHVTFGECTYNFKNPALQNSEKMYAVEGNFVSEPFKFSFSILLPRSLVTAPDKSVHNLCVTPSTRTLYCAACY